MKPKKRQKLCSNCDGEIDLDVIVCPYCAADLREEKPEQQRSAFLQGSVRICGTQENEQDSSVLPVDQEHQSQDQSIAKVAEIPEAPVEKPKQTLGTVLLLTVGVQLLLLGLLLVFLSNNGCLTLKWDARLWFLYVFASVPFLVFGYRSLSKI